MSRYTSKIINDLLNTSAENEELDLPSGNFVATISKSYKIIFILSSVIGILLSLICWCFLKTEWLSILFFALSLVCILYLPTCFSYKGYISHETMREEYLIVFFKVIKEIEWKDIKYKKLKRDEFGEIEGIKFYDENMKRLMSFDKATVGFTRIVKMAKKGSIKEVK
jgi:hypothetical protein